MFGLYSGTTNGNFPYGTSLRHGHNRRSASSSNPPREMVACAATPGLQTGSQSRWALRTRGMLGTTRCPTARQLAFKVMHRRAGGIVRLLPLMLLDGGKSAASRDRHQHPPLQLPSARSVEFSCIEENSSERSHGAEGRQNGDTQGGRRKVWNEQPEWV